MARSSSKKSHFRRVCWSSHNFRGRRSEEKQLPGEEQPNPVGIAVSSLETDFALSYIHDIAIFSDSCEEHKTHVWKLCCWGWQPGALLPPPDDEKLVKPIDELQSISTVPVAVGVTQDKATAVQRSEEKQPVTFQWLGVFTPVCLPQGLGRSPMFRAVLLSRVSPRMFPLLAAVLFQRKERKDTGLSHWRREKHPYYNLTVKVLRARNIRGTDLLSKADCFVKLRLPTASPVTYRTQVVDNSSNPEWNETFQYRIHSAVKNILELSLFDEDVLINDELTSIVFDVGGIKPGQPLKRTFKLNPEAREELDVEFYLEKCSDAPTEILTNGVLVAHPCLCLQGVINKDEKSKQSEKGSCQIKLSMPGAYEKQLCIPCRLDNDQDFGTPFVFHVDKEMCPDLEVELEQTITVLQDEISSDLEKHTTLLGQGTVPVKSLPVGQKVDMAVPLGEGQSLDLSVKAEKSTRHLDVRLGFGLCGEEREFLDKRKKIVSQALMKTLKLIEAPGKDEVPVVAVLGSGGGTRALTSFYGSLSGLQQLGLLDSTMYLCGISGSTWCLSALYQDTDWSCKDLKGAISNARDNVSSSKAGALSSERLKYYFQELNSMENDGRKVSFTDLWGLIIEYFLYQKEDLSKLSDQQEAVKRAQNPYPIYAAISVRPNISDDDFAEWCEFTPYEVGFRKYGAFVRTEDFDSEFFMGRLIRKRPEPRICYLQGMWGSAFAASLDDVFLKMVGSGLSFLDSLKDVIRVIDDCQRFHFREATRLKTRLVIPGGPLLQIFQDFFKSRVTSGETFNFMQGLYLHRNYVKNRNFVAWKGSHFEINQTVFGYSVNILKSCITLAF
ncbi:MAX gene-associated protein [Platysternon megacephalum]|uniref:Phospholipase A2 n=1 Tax=Platysternon megacephalum TaxID=55544 RepID=A0A4D9EW43_9SAUR|nr:MAX gene-associated protein [Platysternon megacephalum]